MKNTQIIACLFLALAACKSSDAGQSSSATPCETGIPELEKLLDRASGIGKTTSDPNVQKEIEAAKKSLVGKRFAFKGCKFSGQGGDSVSFADADEKYSRSCYMAGGEKGVDAFRKKAMKLDREKLKLDVSGTIAEYDHGPFKRLELTECKITAHE